MLRDSLARVGEDKTTLDRANKDANNDNNDNAAC
jgi:hypothetical protein